MNTVFPSSLRSRCRLSSPGGHFGVTMAAERPSRPWATAAHRSVLLLALGLGLAGTATRGLAQDGGAAAAALKILMTPATPGAQAGAGSLTANSAGTLPAASPAAPALAPPEMSATAAATTGAGVVIVQRGETLDRIIRRSLGATPFSADFLRKAFVQLNPHAFRASGNPNLISAGSTLRVPTASQLMQLMQAHYPQTAVLPDDPQHSPAHATDAQARKRWVRFP
jgi:Tfp pilus assembly protein FimV